MNNELKKLILANYLIFDFLVQLIFIISNHVVFFFNKI